MGHDRFASFFARSTTKHYRLQLLKYDDTSIDPNTFKQKKDAKYSDREGFVKYLNGEIENSMKDVVVKEGTSGE